MSFPAALRNHGLADRFAHLRIVNEYNIGAPTAQAAPKRSRRDEKEGKRWIRRKENARFAGNAHIVVPSKKDLSILPPSNRATFPQPLPTYLARNNAVPSVVPAAREPVSANAGRFSLSLKGMRRELRKSGLRTELVVQEVERELVAWLKGGVLLAPDAAAEMFFPGTAVGTTEAIWEVSRTPLQLVWAITDDAFTRYVVHCCARYHDVVSYSKDTSGQRLTYLLRPNVTRPNFQAPICLDTPPTTDLESAFDSESDLLSERDFHSDTGDSDIDADVRPRTDAHTLSIIAESNPSPPLAKPALDSASDSWSVVDADADIEAGDSEGEGLSASVDSLSIMDVNATPRADPRRRQAALRSHIWDHRRRSASSPSRSPARRHLQRPSPRIEPPLPDSLSRSFYDYLFA
ncbi:hypothetical protein OBBRIDRAFT_724120 [Obba rivulosa]|uniref:Uncharacterized protein n=1 Tax=Obba rivulosa TaxID=1052685 RepID=A0A8E2DQ76_9APHY|nr:hypothetical protein OBBRIDRAFT_724120 [Obba rivulosa]